MIKKYQKYKQAAILKDSQLFFSNPMKTEKTHWKEWHDLFKWKLDKTITGTFVNGQIKKDKIKRYIGYLKDNQFNSLNKKIAYLQGVFESSWGKINKNGKYQISINGDPYKVRRVARWIDDILDYLANTMKLWSSNDYCMGKIYRVFKDNDYIIQSNNIEIEINKEIANYIINYKFN